MIIILGNGRPQEFDCNGHEHWPQSQFRFCEDCGQTFEWSAGEQEWYYRQQYAPPRRCAVCRRRARTERAWGKSPRQNEPGL